MVHSWFIPSSSRRPEAHSICVISSERDIVFRGDNASFAILITVVIYISQLLLLYLYSLTETL